MPLQPQKNAFMNLKTNIKMEELILPVNGFLKEMPKLSAFRRKEKFFNDAVHKGFLMHPLCVAIIDTPQFQRLRNIKQLGVACYLYQGATHSRFDHCLGVCHLAGEFAKKLKEKQNTPQSQYYIDEKDILCVQIAGLCHDIGHGPFSHLWEHFLHIAQPNLSWKHEKCSTDMLDYLIEDNNLIGEFKYYFGADKYQIYLNLIKEQISGSSESRKLNPWIIDGKDKSFLYEIVANKNSGVDVDKFDYLARDSYYMGVQNSFDHKHLMEFARVCQAGGKLTICFRDKEYSNLEEMFTTRKKLHRVGFQHRVVKVLDTMLIKMLLLADKHIQINGNQRDYSLSETALDLKAFTLLTDEILYLIRTSKDKNLEAAKNIWDLINNRKFYKYVGKVYIPLYFLSEVEKNFNKLSEEILKYLGNEDRARIKSEDLVFSTQILNNGSDNINPIHRLYFYSKDDETVGYRLNEKFIGKLSPNSEQETFLLCFTMVGDDELALSVNKAFCEWCYNKNFPNSNKNA